MTPNVFIEPFSECDLEPLVQLFSSYFRKNDRLLSREYSIWLYGKNPFGNALMVKVIEAGRLVGFMAMIPVKLRKINEELTAYYVVNVLVHPDFHGKHLFGRMIKASMIHVEQEKSALLGHPNDMALKSWQRAGMQFHKPLRPSLVLPRPWNRKFLARNIISSSECEMLRKQLQIILEQSPSWRVAATPEYLAWRFIDHPTNRYRLQLIERKGEAIGVQISKRIRCGMNLLIDQFLPEDAMGAGSGKLPVFTVCFLPGNHACLADLDKKRPLLDKQIPFFMTRPFTFVDIDSVAHIGLSPSDF